MRLFVIYDRRAEQWMTPFVSRTNGTAYRELGMSVKNADENNILAQHPEDFELFYLGTFDETSGSLVADTPQRLGSLADIAA